MNPDRYVGKRVRLKADARYGQKIALYLTDEQVAEGPEGVVVRAVAERDELVLEVDLENVPMDCRVPADSCVLLDLDPPR